MFLLLRTYLSLVLLVSTLAVAGQKEIEITTFYAKVYVAPSMNANFIGLIQKGERYPILGVKDTWYHIRFKSVNGWIESSQAMVIDPDAAIAAEAIVAAVESTTVAVPPQDTIGTSRTNQSQDSLRQPQSGNGSVQQQTASQMQRSTNDTTHVAYTRTSTPRRTVTARPERKESGIKSWFTQQNAPELPPALNPNEETKEPQKYFQVKLPSAVRVHLDPSAQIIGMTGHGQMLLLIGEGDLWCKVMFNDSIGWVEKRYGKVFDPAASVELDYVKIAVFGGGALLLVLIIVIIVLVTRRKKPEPADDHTVKKQVVIISKIQKSIHYTLTNGVTSLDKCISEVGFGVSYVKDPATLKSALVQQKPDVIMIDVQFDPAVLGAVERICVSIGIAETVQVIVYNLPDPSSMQPGKALQKMLFLGVEFSDRDIFKLITPLLKDGKGMAIQKSVHASALAGNIGDGNLLEVLQFIEIGSKTGCLLIELEKPFAIICFKNGRINFAATSDKITGREAIFKVLELKKGKFRFVLDKKPKASNVNLSTLEVLMEWTKSVDDEARGH